MRFTTLNLNSIALFVKKIHRPSYNDEAAYYT